MKRNPLLPSLLLTSLLLAGCGGVLESKKIDYKSEKRLPSLEVPPDLTSPGMDERYAIPENTRGSATFSSYADGRNSQVRPGAAPAVLAKSDQVRIERAGNQRWLVVNGTPDKLWPTIKEFWLATGFTLNVDMAEAGIMETEWVENRAKLPQDIIRNTIGKALDFMYSTSERDKYRTRLEKGSEPGTTEIYISHRGMQELYINEGRSETRWQPRAADPELEAEMLQRLMVRLGVDSQQAKTLAATGTSQAERAQLVRATDGSAVLNVQESFDRAWRRVGLALDRLGFTVEDRDRSKGVYFVRHQSAATGAPKTQSEKTDKGFLSRLAFWRDDDKPAAATAIQGRIIVKAQGDASTVQVLNAAGAVDTSEVARKLIAQLHEQLK
jgi:outer membrane protein assembly factor BamC